MMKARLTTLFRAYGLAALAAAGLSFAGPLAGPAAAQSGPIIVNPPPGSGLSSLPYVPPPGAQDRGTPPDFQQYPLLSRIFGFGGAIFPGYVSPSNGRTQGRLAYLTGGGQGRTIFAAGTVDRLCQMEQAPEVKVLDAPPGVRLKFDLGAFTALDADGGSHRCIGRMIEGVRVSYTGRAPKGSTATLRVSYPFKGVSYTHVVSFPPK
ncbi:hypothetical protein [Ancylobacter sp.]|uniref:hypothetical protein n=1 Tax=Ancylobacter sp. TaxID=1872567 RepID=UPI003D0E23BF